MFRQDHSTSKQFTDRRCQFGSIGDAPRSASGRSGSAAEGEATIIAATQEATLEIARKQKKFRKEVLGLLMLNRLKVFRCW